MKQQTAMQELIDCLKSQQDHCIKSQKGCKDKVLKKQFEAGATSYTIALMTATKLLQKEEEQIKQAVIYGNRQEHYDGTEKIADTYFNQTYQINQ